MKSKSFQTTITLSQSIFILVFYLIGSSLISGVAKEAAADAPYAIITASLLTVPVYLIFSKILLFFPRLNIYEISIKVLGKFIGNIINVLFIFNGLYAAALVLRFTVDFMQIAGLINTSSLSIIFLIIITVIILINNGLTTFGKWCSFFFGIVMLTLALTVLMSLPVLNPENLLPVFYDGMDPYLRSTAITFSFPFIQASSFLSIFNYTKNTKDIPKIFLYGLFISTIVFLIVSCQNIMIIGSSNYHMTYFPFYMSARRIKLGFIIQRSEIIIVMLFMITSTTKIAVNIFSSLLGIKVIFNLSNYYKFTLPFCFLTAILAFIFYKSLIERMIFIKSTFIPYSLIVNLSFPLLIYITYKVRKHFQII